MHPVTPTLRVSRSHVRGCFCAPALVSLNSTRAAGQNPIAFGVQTYKSVLLTFAPDLKSGWRCDTPQMVSLELHMRAQSYTTARDSTPAALGSGDIGPGL